MGLYTHLNTFGLNHISHILHFELELPLIESTMRGEDIELYPMVQTNDHDAQNSRQ